MHLHFYHMYLSECGFLNNSSDLLLC